MQIGTWSLILGLLPLAQFIVYIPTFMPMNVFSLYLNYLLPNIGFLMSELPMFAPLYLMVFFVSAIAAIITGVMAINRKQSLGYAGIALGTISIIFPPMIIIIMIAGGGR